MLPSESTVFQSDDTQDPAEAQPNEPSTPDNTGARAALLARVIKCLTDIDVNIMKNPNVPLDYKRRIYTLVDSFVQRWHRILYNNADTQRPLILTESADSATVKESFAMEQSKVSSGDESKIICPFCEKSMNMQSTLKHLETCLCIAL